MTTDLETKLHEAHAAGRAFAAAAQWLRNEAKKTDDAVNIEEDDGPDIDRACAEAELLRKASKDLEAWSGAPAGECPRPKSRPYVAEQRQKDRSPVYASFEAQGQLECDVIEWLSANYEPLRRRAAEERAAANKGPVTIDGTSPGAILGELNHLRKLYTAAVVLIGHMMKETRAAEEMAPREAAEQLGNLGTAMQRAYEEHLSGQYEEALKRLAPEPDDDAEAR